MKKQGTKEYVLYVDAKLQESNEEEQGVIFLEVEQTLDSLQDCIKDGNLSKLQFRLWYFMEIIRPAIQEANIKSVEKIQTCFLTLMQKAIVDYRDLSLYLQWLLPSLGKTQINPLENPDFSYVCVEAIGRAVEAMSSEKGLDKDDKQVLTELKNLLIPYIRKAKIGPKANVPLVSLSGEEPKKIGGTLFNLLCLMEEVLQKLTN